jgi:hypothetical protein
MAARKVFPDQARNIPRNPEISEVQYSRLGRVLSVTSHDSQLVTVIINIFNCASNFLVSFFSPLLHPIPPPLGFFNPLPFLQVHLRSPFILNGVCVRWRGWLDLERLDGVGCLEFDEESALLEDAKLREQVSPHS